MKTATSVVMRRRVAGVIAWCIVVAGSRRPWLNIFTIAGTKREAIEKYVAQWVDPWVGKGYLARGEAVAVKIRIERVRRGWEEEVTNSETRKPGRGTASPVTS